jgi:lysophospholipase L1-like esterase
VSRDYEIGCVYIGANDVRDARWDVAAYERDLATALRGLRERCGRVLTMTIPRDLGLPPAGAKVEEANAVIERLAASHGAVVADLRSLSSPAWIWADRVHATATGQVAIADHAARALAAPLPSETVVDPPRPDPWYWWHYGKRAVRERARVAAVRARR